MQRPLQPLPQRGVMPCEAYPDSPPSQTKDTCRYKMVSEVGYAHSDSASQTRREAATALASMRGPLVDLEPPNIDRDVNSYRNPFGEDVLIWETTDSLYRQRRSPGEANYSNDLPSVAAPAAGNRDSAANVNQLSQMMSHLCQSMDAFAQVLKNGNTVTPESAVSQPSATETAAHEVDVKRSLPLDRFQNEQKQDYSAPCASGSRKNVMKPQLFDGKEPINSFLAHFEVCAEFNNWSTKEKLAWLQWSLKGRAQQVLWDLPTSMLSPYEDIVKTLRQRFGSEHQSEVYKIELRNRRRRNNESISELMQDIRRLMVLAYSSATSDIWESVAINAFLEALDDSELALEVRKRGPVTLESAYREAMLLDGYMRVANKGKTSQSKRPEQIRATATVTPDTKDLRREVDELRKQLGKQEAQQKQMMTEHAQHMERLLHDQPGSAAPRMSLPPSAYSSHPDQVRGRQPRHGNCFKCGQPGHGYRFCQAPVPPQQLDHNSLSAMPPTTSHFISGSRSAYLPCRVFGKNRWCLLDTGSEVSVIPARCVPEDELVPTSQILNAANGTNISVIGEAKLTIELDGCTVTTRGLVSEHVDEFLLGLTFLEETGCIWNFKERSIEIKGAQFKLYAHKPTWSVRRIVLQDTVDLQPRCQQNVPAKTIYSNLAPSFSDWMSQPIEVKKGVRLVRTVVSDQPTDVHVNIVNTNDHTVTLAKGLPLGRLEEVQLMETGSTSPGTSHADDGDTTHIESLLQGVDESVDNATRCKLQDLLYQHKDVFSRDEYDLGRATMVKHRIDTGDARPFRQPLRRQPAHLLPIIDEQLQEMQRQGIIRPAQSEWGSNLVVVKKKDGSLRFCVDYRQLNERTVKDTNPLTRIDDCLDTLGGSTWFSTMDLRSGYHQVALDSRDADKPLLLPVGEPLPST